MAKSGKSRESYHRAPRSSEGKLGFYSFNTPAADKATVQAKIASGEMSFVHLAATIKDTDWIKIKYDANTGSWIVMLSFTPETEIEPSGIYSFRARHLENALGLAVWHSDEFDERHFVADDDNDF